MKKIIKIMPENNRKKLTQEDSLFLAHLRALAIFIIVFGHVGGFWIYRPYSEFLHAIIPVFFFISGAVLYFSYLRSETLFSFYIKRFIGLFVPYYLVCVFSIVVFVIFYKTFPEFKINNLVKWLEIRPNNAIMPFPLGQVWFLHTLFIITLCSPLYFNLLQRKQKALWYILSLMLILSILQHSFDIGNNFYLFGNNFFKPMVHSIFFIFGAYYFSYFCMREQFKLAVASIFFLLIELMLIYFFIENIDYSYHTFSPDFYYVVGSLFIITFLLTFQKSINFIVESFYPLKKISAFFYKHTFSIFLLHSFAIFFAERVFGLVGQGNSGVRYGIVKLMVVLLLTCLLAIPFSWLSTYLSKKLDRLLNIKIAQV